MSRVRIMGLIVAFHLKTNTPHDAPHGALILAGIHPQSISTNEQA